MNKNNAQKIKTNINDNDTIKLIEKKSSMSIVKIDNKINIQNNSQNNDDSDKYIDCEIKEFSYEEAVDYDKRSLFENFISLIKTNHWLVFWIYSNTDYNHITIKICLLVFSFALHYNTNTLFFDDSTMNKIYEDEGVFNFIYLIPKTLYSIIISSIIMIIIKKLALSDAKIIDFKKINDIKECENEMPKTIKCLKIKFICFFSLCSIFLVFFSYYVSCFCAVYKKLKYYLLKIH